jgi:hypothetical protein
MNIRTTLVPAVLASLLASGAALAQDLRHASPA